MDQTGRRPMLWLAERALDRTIAMYLAVEVLIDAIPVLEVAITWGAVEVFLDLVVVKAFFIIKVLVAVVTLIVWRVRFRGLRPVAHVIHVLVDGLLTAKILIARVALKIWGTVTRRVHVLLPRLPASRKYAPTGSAGGHVETGKGSPWKEMAVASPKHRCR